MVRKMGRIQVLDQNTIDKIAAGEVVERPSSVVKELVENAVDAGATAITVEIKEGGTTFLRVTDNGSGIPADQVRLAFLRHSTSKIRKVEDLSAIASLGFRGEALSSIAAVSMVELITKVREDQTGTRYCIEGGEEKELEETAAPEGTTFLIRSLFYNTPARRKFLRSPMTEAGYIGDLMERMALSRPDISFRFVNNGQVRLHTTGNHSLRDVIYQIYGREITENLIQVEREQGPMQVTGYIGKPLIGRGNRNFETYFVNGRYVKSSLIAKGIEEAYKTLLMQHKYPFVVLNFAVDGGELDVNVHPTKMEIRFSDQEQVYRFVQETLRDALLGRELIPQVKLGTEEKDWGRTGKDLVKKESGEPGREKTHVSSGAKEASSCGEPSGQKADSLEKPGKTSVRNENREDKQAEKNTEDGWRQAARAYEPRERNLEYFLEEMQKRVRKAHEKPATESEMQPKLAAMSAPEGEKQSLEDVECLFAAGSPKKQVSAEKRLREKNDYGPPTSGQTPPGAPGQDSQSLGESRGEPAKNPTPKAEARQLELFEEKFLDPRKKEDIRVLGQLFETYWLVQKGDTFYMIDQHAAHEKVLFERLMGQMERQEVLSQMVSPPLVLSLNLAEIQTLESYKEAFTRMGFVVEPFGGKEYAISAVPAELYGIAERELFLEMLDSLSDRVSPRGSRMVLERLATMSCKAAVKGNQRMSEREARELMEALFTLENPYTCPHGRPTIISMTRQEIERKFKRIV
jgi:DNA mismatch repair protein MutL